MANTYTWKVGQCDRLLETGVINTLHYTVTAVTEDGVYSAGAYGSISLEAPEAETMIPYDSVTEANCVMWVKAAIGGEEKVAEIEAALGNQLTEKRSPTTGTGLPWSAA
jgi:hypothetical protein